jgi:hypothetical protein
MDKTTINVGDIEISVPANVVGNLKLTTLKGNEFLCPIRNGIVKVDEEVAETLLSGNNGQPLPGYAKAVISPDDKGPGSGTTGAGKANKDTPSDDEIRVYLTGKGAKFHPKLGTDKLQALYAVEMKKDTDAAAAGTGDQKSSEPLTVEGYEAITTEDLAMPLAATTDPELIKQLIAAEANGEARQDRIDLLTVRLTELTA